MPVSPSEISNPVFADENEALMMLVKTSVSPKTISLQSATKKAIRKKAIQIYALDEEKKILLAQMAEDPKMASDRKSVV